MISERVKAILVKEFKQIFRDPRMRTVIFISPLLQIILFGYAANKDINYVPTAIYDQDNTVESRELLRRFTYSKYFVPEHYIFSEKEQNRVLDKGLASVAIRIDRGFGRNVNSGKDASIQMVFDGTDSNTAMIIMGYANTVVGDYQQGLLKKEIASKGLSGNFPRVDLRDRAWFNSNLISTNYYL
ncbi:MAG: ABC transporter permease, partial [Candidatus Omnitrophica bacterium]|nr:ABC transporter permease [Candidatus Omnitrophota bacterium]